MFWAFVLHFAFAFYSVGNAEFMVMLPLFIIIWIVLKFAVPTKPVLYISLMLLFWNVVFGLAPARFLDMDGSRQLMAKMEKYPEAKWIVNEPQKMENMYDYYNGENASSGKIIRAYKNDTFQIALIMNLAKDELLTDCINSEQTFSRHSISFTFNDFHDDLSTLGHERIDSIEFFGGKKRIDRLLVK